MESIKVKAGCIGTGVMGSALMEAVIRVVGGSSVAVCDADSLKAEAFCAKTGSVHLPTNSAVASAADYVFLAVKPQFLSPVLAEIAPVLDADTVIVSMAAGVSIETLAAALGGHRKIIRIMPNTPAAVSAGMIAVSVSPAVSDGELVELERLLSRAGLCERTPEALMDAVTAVSGSGPAYGYLFIDALADAAVHMGMNRQQALRYAAQTLKGAAEMVLTTGSNPSVLKDGVCSPSGTTIAAVRTLEAKGFRSAIIEAALAAWDRSRALGNPK